jgi:hypothetical protein
MTMKKLQELKLLMWPPFDLMADRDSVSCVVTFIFSVISYHLLPTFKMMTESE